MTDRQDERLRMVERQIHNGGTQDHAGIAETEEVPRHRFVPALMIEAAQIDGSSRVLEVRAGFSSVSAVLSRIAKQVFAIERHASLARQAQERVAAPGYRNARVLRRQSRDNPAPHRTSRLHHRCGGRGLARRRCIRSLHWRRPSRDDAPSPFQRFHTWMWRNTVISGLLQNLRANNAGRAPKDQVAFYGFDIYKMADSVHAVLSCMDEHDHDAAVARRRCGCLARWQSDSATYGRAALPAGYAPCEDALTASRQS